MTFFIWYGDFVLCHKKLVYKSLLQLQKYKLYAQMFLTSNKAVPNCILILVWHNTIWQFKNYNYIFLLFNVYILLFKRNFYSK